MTLVSLTKMINYYLFFASGVDELHRSHEKIEAKIGKRNPIINMNPFLSFIKSKEGDENGSTYKIFVDGIKCNSYMTYDKIDLFVI